MTETIHFRRVGSTPAMCGVRLGRMNLVSWETVNCAKCIAKERARRATKRLRHLARAEAFTEAAAVAESRRSDARARGHVAHVVALRSLRDRLRDDARVEREAAARFAAGRPL